ncbi:hypothetical protein MIMGU_mgv1a0260442mg, partial [Erythranthe guttata]
MAQKQKPNYVKRAREPLRQEVGRISQRTMSRDHISGRCGKAP